MWVGGPSWHDLPAFTKPLDPGTDDKGVYRNKVWDFWMTDYDPQFHSHIFADCPFNTSSTEEGKSSTEEGKSSTGAGKDLCSSLYQKSSWFTYHGTSITSAIVSVAMNWINRSEKVFGEATPNDEKHPRAGQTEAKEYGPNTYETAMQRGIYTSTDWTKAVGYACPYAVLPPAINRPLVVAQIVLLVRVPGSLEKVGVSLQVGPPKRTSYHYQQDLEGNQYVLSSNWGSVDLEQTFGEVIEARRGDISKIRHEGFFRWMLEKERAYMVPEWCGLCLNGQMRFDPEIQKRVSRKEMQVKAQKTHTGEERWTNIDNQLVEVGSSGCAIVGFFCRLRRGAGQEHL